MKMGEIGQSNLDEELGMLTLIELRKRAPTCDERRAIVLRDALACVDGFRTLVQLVMEYMFGCVVVLHVRIVHVLIWAAVTRNLRVVV